MLVSLFTDDGRQCGYSRPVRRDMTQVKEGLLLLARYGHCEHCDSTDLLAASGAASPMRAVIFIQTLFKVV